MDLWIRSQDKRLLYKVDRLAIDDTNSIFCDYDDVYLGKYKTKERALEVLDEIQEILKPKTIIKFNDEGQYDEKNNFIGSKLVPYETFDIKQLSTYVYEMSID